MSDVVSDIKEEEVDVGNVLLLMLLRGVVGRRCGAESVTPSIKGSMRLCPYDSAELAEDGRKER